MWNLCEIKQWTPSQQMQLRRLRRVDGAGRRNLISTQRGTKPYSRAFLFCDRGWSKHSEEFRASASHAAPYAWARFVHFRNSVRGWAGNQ